MTDDIAHIESQNRGLQVQTSNQRALLAELDKLMVRFPLFRFLLSFFPAPRCDGRSTLHGSGNNALTQLDEHSRRSTSPLPTSPPSFKNPSRTLSASNASNALLCRSTKLSCRLGIPVRLSPFVSFLFLLSVPFENSELMDAIGLGLNSRRRHGRCF
jgi:hypothetical protein